MHDLIRKLTWLIVIPAVLLILVGSYVRLYGVVEGVQFSPDRMCHRSFHYYQLFGVQVWPQSRSEWKTPLEEYLHANGMVPMRMKAIRGWDLVAGSKPGTPDWKGSAYPMCSELGCVEGGSGKWVEWSYRNKELAAQLWPRVISLARESKYDKISKALLAAKLAEKDGNFEKYYEEFAEGGK